MMTRLRSISLEQLVARIAVMPRQYGFLLGAGCSVGAGVPAARGVIAQVARQLGRDPAAWEPSYSEALEALGPPAIQQAFLRKLIEGKAPAEVHLELAALVQSRWVSVAFTTNFDQLIEKAISKCERPCVVVNDEGIAAKFVAWGGLDPNAPESFVVKLHGEYLIPGTLLNLPWQLAKLTVPYTTLLSTWLSARGLVVVGYRSGDASVRRALEEGAVSHGLPLGLIWVLRHGDEVPGWVQALDSMRPSPWIEILRVRDSEEFFMELRSALGDRHGQPMVDPAVAPVRDHDHKDAPGTARANARHATPRSADSTPTDRAEYDVFLSHNHQQKEWVRLFAQQLRACGLSVFFDEDSIKPGADIVESIEQAVEASRHVLLILSPTSIKSRWVALETAIAVYNDPDASNNALIPILLEPLRRSEIRTAVRRLSMIDLTNPSSRANRFAYLLQHLGIPKHRQPHPPPWPSKRHYDTDGAQLADSPSH